MVSWPFDGKALPRSGGEKSLDSQFKIVAEAFLESFELLEEYAPIWYTEQHHKRALTACRILQKVQGNSMSMQAVLGVKSVDKPALPKGRH